MNTLVIGDIHGCHRELLALLDRAGLSSADRVIALGDIVDRGPDPGAVLRFFQERPHASSLMGNHERKHLRSARGEIRPSLSQIITRVQLGEEYADALAFLETFPTFLELSEAILVHGYLEPGIPLVEQSASVLCGTMGGDHTLREKYERPWYELYDREKPAIVGHYDYQRSGEPFIYRDRVFGLDTSCVHGSRLTGLVLPEFRFVSVQSSADYWSESRSRYAAQRHARAAPEERPWDEDLLDQLLAHAAGEHERVLALLHTDPSFATLTPREQARAYTLAIGKTPLAPLLHRFRLGALDREALRRVLRTPQRAREMAAAMERRAPCDPETQNCADTRDLFRS